MKREEVLELVKKYGMEPKFKNTNVVDCYGEPVVMSQVQIGWVLDSVTLVKELDELAEHIWESTETPVTREWDGEKYVYTVYCPENWF